MKVDALTHAASATNLGQLTDLIAATKLDLDRPAVEALNLASASG